MTDVRENRLAAILYPCARVRHGQVGGSGTIIYSKPGPNGEWKTYLITCHHVIASAISLNDEWDPLLGKERKREQRSRVIVEEFNYKYGSRAIGVNSCEADIEAWDKKFDLAILKLRSVEQAKHVARMFPQDRTREISLLDTVYVVGCALGHEPILTEGRIT